ncbi:ATP-binding cassette domain-containing protein [Roseomonas sp. PWR1]|uniref:ATP-binding cassette domain-containing protein n=2 Tax=Roseomonas nitratireducens TaxID=2820810 RepID=A0ABS4ASA2_9PROT|nr:ATP-binding cassette domain-containing protein [Neoroseomonas nitratireducens]
MERAATYRLPGLVSARIDTLAASALLNIVALAVPVLLLQVYDRIIPNAAYGTLAALLMGVAVAVAIEAALRHARASITAWSAAQEEHALTRLALSRILHAHPRAAATSGAQADGLAAIAEWRAHRTGQLAFALADLPFALVYLGFLAWLSPLLAGIAMLAGLPGLLAAAAVAPLAARAIADRTTAEAARHDLTFEAVAAIEPLKAMGAEAAMLRRHERLVATSAAAGRRTAFAVQLCQSLSMAGSQCVTAAVALAGAWLVMQDQLAGGALAAAILLASRGLEPVARLAASTPTLARASAARARIGAILATPQQPRGGATVEDIGELSIEGLRLAAPHRGLLLRDADLTLRRGECVALRGPGGSGKTRLLLAIAGLIPADGGTMRVDGRDRATLDEASLRRHVALLPQRPTLLPGRVIDNLCRFDPALEEDALALAAELGLDEHFHRLPAGYATQVGRGDAQELPPSVAERVAAVRALVARPRIILFDDAAASQDRDGERRMRELLRRLKPGAAILMVTDRRDWLAIADRRLRIEECALVEDAPS